MTDVLICGAGIAGSTLAWWLARRGLRPTVVERAQGRRSSGSPVDVRGPAVAVARDMGVLAALRERATRVRTMTLVDAADRPIARVDLTSWSGSGGEVELPRGDLAAVLGDAAIAAGAELRLGDTITALEQDEGGVDVAFAQAAPRRFDLVVGADGLHSAVRRLAFGAEETFVRHLGMYVGTVPLDGEPVDPDDVRIHNVPGRAVAIHPGNGRAMAAFLFHRPEVAGFDHRDPAAHRRLLQEVFGGDGWRVPELLARVRKADDLYLDAVSRVSLPVWSRGRVALVGDAGACVSLFGDGSSLAMSGAATLATALAAHPGDHVTALRRYEREHRALAGPRLRGTASGARLLVPRTPAGLALRNAAVRLLPLVTAAQRLRPAARAAA